MGFNPFTQSTVVRKGISSLGSSEFSVLEFRECKAGGLSDPTVNSIDASAPGEKQSFEISDGRIKQKEDELRGVDDGEDGIEIILSSTLASPPLMEIVNQESQIPSEHTIACILSCPLKRIDLAFRSGQGAKGKAKEIVAIKLHYDQLEVPEVPIEDMQFDEGGEVPNSS